MITGQCLCGGVTYRSTAAPVMARVCWCRLCQYLGAGSGTVNVCFLRETFSIVGALSDFASTADSGTVMHRRFCGICGTPMFSEAESRPHLIFVRAGTLHDPTVARPTLTMWTSQAPPWACIDAGLPSHPAQPPPAA